MTFGANRSKMAKAAWLMSITAQGYKVNSRIYQTLQEEHSKLNASEDRRRKTSESMKKYHSTNKWTSEMRQLAREKALLNGNKPPSTVKGKPGTWVGKSHSEESKAKISLACKIYWAKKKGQHLTM
jgi:hypothetical protein